MDNFTVGKIRRSLQRFLDFAGDLSRANSNTFEDRLSLLMHYCQNDEIFKVIDDQLLATKSVDFTSWYAERISSMKSMMGSGQLFFPTDLDNRLSLMYQLLHKINSKEINLLDFTHTFFAIDDDRHDSYIDLFNDAIVLPMMRELGYRFEELEESLPENQRDTVPLANVQIIHNAHTVIQQSATGSSFSQSATVGKGNDLHKLFDDLKKEVLATLEDATEKHEAMQLIESAEVLSAAKEPKPASVKALLNTLPPLGNIASIISAILSMISL